MRRFLLLIVFTSTVILLLSVRGEEVLHSSIESTVGITLVPVQAGEFTMGSPESEKSRRDDESQVSVKLTKPFLISEAEITQGQWKDVMGTSFKELLETKAGPLGRGANLVLEPSATGDDQPMCFVNWSDAMSFCEKLTAKEQEAGTLPEGYRYSLPSEAQWEYTCRAGTMTVFSYGDTLTSEQANFYGPKPYGLKEEGVYREKTTPVKSFEPNAWGIYDMHGNLYEWCLDWYAETLAGGEDPSGAVEGEGRVIRGGTWNRTATSCRSAYRYSAGPDSRSYNIGFRVVVVPE